MRSALAACIYVPHRLTNPGWQHVQIRGRLPTEIRQGCSETTQDFAQCVFAHDALAMMNCSWS